jgi:Polysaccharide pyruvyl transferase/2OG-Fe(II) oxygenase superfamily
MLNLDAIRSAPLQSDPFEWALVDRAIERSDAETLLDTFPVEDFWVIEDDDGEKSYSYAARPLVTLGSEAVALGSELAPAWRELGEDLVTPAYRDALGALIGRSLADARMEASIWRWDADAQLGPHRDMEEKIVTQVFYLSRIWDRGWGGCLRILRSRAGTDIAAELPPEGGTASVLVRSGSSWHSVSPVLGAAREPRRSIIVTWFRPDSSSPVWREEGGTVTCVASGSVRERARALESRANGRSSWSTRTIERRPRSVAGEQLPSVDQVQDGGAHTASRVAMVGTFDIANYGDLLLPLIAAHELRVRLGEGYEPTLYSYRPMSSADWPHEVRPLARLREEIGGFDLLLVGGGQLIRADRGYPAGYGPTDASVHHPLGLWLTPMLLAAAAGVPVALNAPGVSSDIPSWLDAPMAAAVQATGHLAVRDAISARLLAERVAGAPVRIVPDSGFGASELLADGPSQDFTDLIDALGGAEHGYIVVQPSPELREYAGAVRAVISAARERGLAVFELPISPVHGDEIGCLGALGDTSAPREWPGPLLITELICRAQAVVAQSYHAGAVAIGAGVPLYRPPSPPGWKYEALEATGVHTLAPASPGELPKPDFEPRAHTEASRERTAQLRTHWDAIAALARHAERSAPSPAALSLISGLAHELHAREEAAERLRERIVELEDACASSAGRTDALEADFATLLAQKDDVVDEHASLKDELASARARIAVLEDVRARKSVRLALAAAALPQRITRPRGAARRRDS